MTEPLVLLPGMMCDARLYWQQIVAFSGGMALQFAPVTTADTIEALAVDVLARAPDRFALAGLSMGGIVAMEVIRRAPERVTRIALMDTNPLAESPDVAARREPQMVRVRAGRLRQVMVEEMKPNYLAAGPEADAILDLVLDMAETLGPDVFVRQSRALRRRPDQQGTLRRIGVPALVLCGEHDRLCPVRRHELMAELIPTAVLVVIPGAGHLPVLEAPASVNRALEQWLLA